VLADDNDDAGKTLRLLMKSLGRAMDGYELARRIRADTIKPADADTPRTVLDSC
jgi:CheY-like chemotaxis protein